MAVAVVTSTENCSSTRMLRRSEIEEYGVMVLVNGRMLTLFILCLQCCVYNESSFMADSYPEKCEGRLVPSVS